MKLCVNTYNKGSNLVKLRAAGCLLRVTTANMLRPRLPPTLFCALPRQKLLRCPVLYGLDGLDLILWLKPLRCPLLSMASPASHYI